MPAAGRVLVLGASGALGRRVVRLLGRATPCAEVVGAGRRPSRAPTPTSRRLDRSDRSTWADALAGVDVLVHAAGPYADDPRPLATACLRARVHWVDLAEDPVFGARVREAAATEGDACAVTGCSTVPGLVEALAAGLPAAAARETARVDAVLSLGSRNPVSAGLLFGLLRPLGAPAPDGGRWYVGLATHRFADGAVRRVGRYPSGLEPMRVATGEPDARGPGAAEAGVVVGSIRGPRVPLRFFVGFDRAWLVRALGLAGRVLPRMSSAALGRLARVAAPLATAVRPFGTARGRLAVLARDASGRVVAGVEVHAEREGLDVPAAPAAWAAAALLAGGGSGGGPRRLVDLVPPPRVLDALRELGCELHAVGEAAPPR